ncbi:MAG: M24 family metallopeptidase [Solirubrobacterales bacterium]
MSVPAGRRTALAALLGERALDRLIVSAEHDLRWLTGFTGSSGLALVPAAGDPLFLTDFRYVEQASEQLPAGWTVKRTSLELLGTGLGEATSGEQLGAVGFDPSQVTVEQLSALSGALEGRAGLVEAKGLVAGLRQVKDEDEVARIRAASQLADSALFEVVGRGLAGRSEREVATDLETTLIGLGADGMSFPPIVAFGAHGALPHAEPRDEEIPRGVLVTIDWGARLDGYCSDCTRTFATGAVGERGLEVYELVNAARAAGIEAARPGRSGPEVDSVARAVIEEAGFGEFFGHGLGHGVGLEVHEAPRLSPRGGPAPLEPGMVVTVEPGIYLPGELGVRIEDLIVVGDGEPTVLTSLDRELVEVD